MPNHLEPDWLLGRRFASDFTVVALGAARPGVPDDPEREVVLRVDGALHTISFGELRTLIEAGFVKEA